MGFARLGNSFGSVRIQFLHGGCARPRVLSHPHSGVGFDRSRAQPDEPALQSWRFMASHSKTTVLAAIAGNLALAITKFVAAAVTQSAAMLSEGIHSTVDTGNGLLLLMGMKLSKRPADKGHPFGHGMDLYFWTLIVALLIFGVGGGLSIYEGILHLWSPQMVSNVVWNYAVLGIGLVFEGITWVIAVARILSVKGDESIWRTIAPRKIRPSSRYCWRIRPRYWESSWRCWGFFSATNSKIPILTQWHPS